MVCIPLALFQVSLLIVITGYLVGFLYFILPVFWGDHDHLLWKIAAILAAITWPVAVPLYVAGIPVVGLANVLVYGRKHWKLLDAYARISDELRG